MASRVSVLGAGSWGTALALHLGRLEHRVTLWGRSAAVVESLGAAGEEADQPEGDARRQLAATTDLQAACREAEVLVVACPSHAVRELGGRIRAWVPRGCLVVATAKGIERETHLLMTAVLEEVLAGAGARVGVLSGPSFAKEVALGMPTAVTAAAAAQSTAEGVQAIFNGPTFRVYTSTDVVGVQIGGAAKNVVALAAGVSDGMGFGSNTRAALITRGLAEVTRLAVAMGAHPQTLAGLSGMGDLVLTCTGDLSRNRQVGLRLGRGESLAGIVSSMHEVAEGVHNTRSVTSMAAAIGVEMPIAEQMYLVVEEGKDPKSAVVDLMTRRLRSELDDPDGADN
jgi:glycerol-3-phosphate dehydrogenase (NAD(P)+)